MMNIGDKVLIRNSGVCEIVGIDELDFGFGNKKYYLIQPIFHDTNNKIRVPVDSESSFKKILSCKEIDKYFSKRTKFDHNWENNSKKRRTVFLEILNSDDEKKIIGLLKLIVLKQNEVSENNKTLSMTDRQTFEKGLKIISEEYAVQGNMNYEDARSYLLSKLQ